MVVICTEVDPARSFRDMLVTVRQTLLEAQKHQAYPPRRLLGDLGISVDQVVRELFAVSVSLQGLHGTLLPDIRRPFDIRFAAADHALRVVITYEECLYERGTVERFAQQLDVVLAQALANPTTRLSSLSLLADSAKASLIELGRGTEQRGPDWGGNSLMRELQRVAVEDPDRTALVSGDTAVSYGEVHRRAAYLAKHLRELGVGLEVIVGICMPRSIDAVISILAVLRAGGAYLPLDPDYPSARLHFMVRDAGATLVLTETHCLERIDGATTTPPVSIDALWPRILRQESLVADDGNEPSPETLAYVIYTSGSSGQPKGVGIPHRALWNHMRWMLAEFRLDATERILQRTPLSFDASVWELFASLLAGGTLVLAAPQRHGDTSYLAELIAEQQVTAAQFVPSLLAVFVEHLDTPLRSLRHVFSGGEPLSRAQLAQIRRVLDCPLHNLYGPTETCIDATWWSALSDASADQIAIGRPITNTWLAVLDDQMQLVPAGAIATLFISGAGLARGYIDRPALTAESFLPDPFSMRPGERTYCTGDRCRFLPNGQLGLLGRNDGQVKLRGHRVELREIESVIEQHPAVKAAVVIAVDFEGDPRLAAYVVSREPSSTLITELIAHARAQLPAYMVPASVTLLDALPLMPNGKVDRKSLPRPAARKTGFSQHSDLTPTQELLAGIWTQLLGTEPGALDDNFFDLGGHSLLATDLLTRVVETTGVEVSLYQFFDNPTLGALAAYIDSRLSASAGGFEWRIEPIQRIAPLRLSFAQQRLWLLDRLTPHSPAYNVAGAVAISGPLHVPAMQRSLEEVVRRHESLRTTFHVDADSGLPVQAIADPAPVLLPVVEPGCLGLTSDEDALVHLLRTDSLRPFDLERGPLFRFTLLRTRSNEHTLIVVLHHIVCDGWSLTILVNEVGRLYEAFAGDRPPKVAEPQIQYADFAQWQRDWLQGDTLATQLAYWRQQLAGAPHSLRLPTDRQRGEDASWDGASVRFLVPQSLLESLKQLSSKESCTLFMTLLTAWQVLLYRYSGQTDFLVGTPVANRRHTATQQLIGLFVNTLLMRANLREDPSFRQLLHNNRAVTLGAFANQDLPFEMVVDELQPQRRLNEAPLFQVLFALHNTRLPDFQMEGLVTRPLTIESTTAKFDLSLSMREVNDALEGTLEYSTELFDQATIEAIARHYEQILASAIHNADLAASRVSLLSVSDQEEMRASWNAAGGSGRQPIALEDLLDGPLRRAPDAVAVVYEGRHVTYGELARRANALAMILKQHDCGSDVVVPIVCERSVEMLVAILAVLRAGAAYAPLDPEEPPERLRLLIDDLAPRLLITQPGLAVGLDQDSTHVIFLDADAAPSEAPAPSLPPRRAHVDDLLYVLFTSGSTGRPKGVMVRRGSVTNQLEWMSGSFGFRTSDRFLQLSPYTFDISVWEMLLPLCCGATLVLAKHGAQRSPEVISHAITDEAITVAEFVPTTLRALLSMTADVWPTLRHVYCAGEVLTADLVAHCQTRAPATIHNLYGPTETSINVTCWSIQGAHAGRDVPIGHALPNVKMAIMQGADLVPDGLMGEMCIGGVALARGYFNRPDLTAAAFRPDPLATDVGQRLFRTGDLARRSHDGVFRFAGRYDHQIKLNGHRIELGEIEAAISSHPHVQQAAVKLFSDAQPPYLAAYVMADAVGSSADELRAFLMPKLPSSMVPTWFVFMSSLPTTPTGKIDRTSLASPATHGPDQPAIVAPSTPTEFALAAIWSQLLNVGNISAASHFFELGGDSLLATQSIARARDVLGIELQLRVMFAFRLREIAALIDQEKAAMGSGLTPHAPSAGGGDGA